MAVRMAASPRSRSSIALLLSGPVIWSAHFMVVYLVVEAGCTGEGPGLAAFAPPVPTAVTLAATAVGALACAGCALWGWRRWHADRREPATGAGLEPPDRGGALAFAGFLLALLGVVEVLFVGLPALWLPAC